MKDSGGFSASDIALAKSLLVSTRLFLTCSLKESFHLQQGLIVTFMIIKVGMEENFGYFDTSTALQQ